MANFGKLHFRLLVGFAGIAMLAGPRAYAHCFESSGGGPSGGRCCARDAASSNCCQVANSTSPWKSDGQPAYCEGYDSGGYYTRGYGLPRSSSGVGAYVQTQGGTAVVVGKVLCTRPNTALYFLHTNGAHPGNDPQYVHCATSEGDVRSGYGCHIESACAYP